MVHCAGDSGKDDVTGRTRVFECPQSGGEIDITVSGDGNSTTYSIHASGAQFDCRPGERDPYPLRFEVVGEWEFRELAEAFALQAGFDIVDQHDQPDLSDVVELRHTFLGLLDQSDAPAGVVASELLRLLLAHAKAYGLDVEDLAAELVDLGSQVAIVPMLPGGDA